MRDFARAAWPLDLDEEHEVHEQAASWFEASGHTGDALREYTAAANPTAVSRILETEGEGLLASGETEAVVAFVDGLPVAQRTREIDRLLADAFLARGEVDRAIACLDRWAPKTGSFEPDLAWRLMLAHYLLGELEPALDFFSRARRSSGAPPDEALVLAWGAASLYRTGALAESHELSRRALELAHACGDDRALATAHNTAVLVGEADAPDREIEAHLRAALAAAERAGDLFQVTRTHTNAGYVNAQIGHHQAALDNFDLAVALAEATAGGSLAHALQNRGGVHLRLGALDAAQADYEHALEIIRETKGYGGMAWRGLGEVFRERGDVALARAACERARAEAGQLADLRALASAHRLLATLLVDDDPDEAARLAEDAAEYSPERARAVTAQGWIALACGAPAVDIADRALELARGGRDPDGLAEALALSAFASGNERQEATRLEDALAIWQRLTNPLRAAIAELALARLSTGVAAQARADRAERRLRSLGVRISAGGPAGLLRMVARPAPAAVAIQTLGGFRVLRDGLPVGGSEWPSRKARELLKILVARRGRATPREFVMEQLWPGEDRSKLGNRLSVALSTLRSVLDPERRFDSEHFVRSDRDSVVLDLDEVAVDVELFLHEAEAGLTLRSRRLAGEAVERLEQAEAAYAGDFLDEDLYQDWAIGLREECRATYVEVAHALAAECAGEDDDASSRYLLRILTRDAYDERAHLRLVATLERLGRRGEARRAYRTYVSRMGEIGVAPAAFPAADPAS